MRWNLDEGAFIRQFEEIERKVERLIDRIQALEDEKTEMGNEIDRLNTELQAKVDAENQYIKEKSMIRARIDNLLNRLEDVKGE
jgi:chromosome segregation ATPase